MASNRFKEFYNTLLGRASSTPRYDWINQTTHKDDLSHFSDMLANQTNVPVEHVEGISNIAITPVKNEGIIGLYSNVDNSLKIDDENRIAYNPNVLTHELGHHRQRTEVTDPKTGRPRRMVIMGREETAGEGINHDYGSEDENESGRVEADADNYNALHVNEESWRPSGYDQLAVNEALFGLPQDSDENKNKKTRNFLEGFRAIRGGTKFLDSQTGADAEYPDISRKDSPIEPESDEDVARYMIEERDKNK